MRILKPGNGNRPGCRAGHGRLTGAWRRAFPGPANPALRPAIIDYEAHPYISPVFNEITQEERDQALRSFEKRPPGQTGSSRPSSGRVTGIFARFPWLKPIQPAILPDVESTLRKEGFIPPREKLDEENRAVFDRLWKDGAVSFRIPPAQKSELVRALGPMIAATDKKLTAKGGKRMVHADIRTDCNASEQPDVMKILNGILADLGILQMAAVYCGTPATVKHLSLMINQTANMESIFGTYYEEAWGFRPQKMPKAVYYHVDSMPGQRPVPVCHGQCPRGGSAGSSDPQAH